MQASKAMAALAVAGAAAALAAKGRGADTRSVVSDDQATATSSTISQPHLLRAPVASKPAPTMRAEALYEFVGSRVDELSFAAGELLLIDGTATDGWLQGRRRNAPDVKGLVPYNYVTVLGEDAKLPEPTVHRLP